MKRRDAFRKIRTICQRLDAVDLATFPVVPLRAYLFGSVLTDKPNPADIDVILVYDRPPHYDPQAEYTAMVYGRPIAPNRASTQLRRGMKMVQLYMAEFGLDGWNQAPLLLAIKPRLIWQPGGDWQTALDQLEASPLPWEGDRPESGREELDAYVLSMSGEELTARIEQAIAELEAQEI